jgi:lipopolysaccharide export system protein LptA
VLLTIERIRTGVLIAGALLIVALGVFLTLGRWRSPFSRRDLPKKLGIDVQQEANGFTQAGFHAGHATFRITASKVEQLKDDRYRLHVVKIEMFDPNGSADRIEGSEFEYDQQTGIAKAAGPVEITLNRPPSQQPGPPKKPAEKANSLPKPVSPTGPAPSADANKIHVRTSGLTFDQNSGVAVTREHVDFDMQQGWGSSMGASYDSENGKLVLDRAVDLNTRRGADPVHLQAGHAEFDRDANLCTLRSVTAQFRNGNARAEQAAIQFRDDGSAQQLDASNGLEMTTATGGKLAAPNGTLQFDDTNQPKHGHLSGGVTIDSKQSDRSLHGTAPTADLQFDQKGFLRQAHLERKVNFISDQQAGASLQVHREWTSPVADLEFRNGGQGQLALDSIHGIEGVAVTSQSQHSDGAASHARLSADDVRGVFAADSALSSMTGLGHARIEQTTETGTEQSTTGDRLEARFRERQPGTPKTGTGENGVAPSEIDRATVIGHVVMFQQPAQKPGAPLPAALEAMGARADYDGATEVLNLTGTPRVENGGLQLTADTIEVARATGDAFAHGNVKATWLGSDAQTPGRQSRSGTGPQVPSLSPQGPSHVIAAEAQIHQQTGEATFRGHARLWQQANSVSAPVIVLDRVRQTLVAQAVSPAEPVRVILLSASTPTPGKTGKSDKPSVVRVRGGDLKYSDAERKAVMQSAGLGEVVTETAYAVTRSSEVELTLLPPGNHAAPDGGQAEVDKMIARGHVVIDAQGRRGTGEQLAYTSQSGDYVLTGTEALPPRMMDPNRGTVTGGALIFNSRDDSVKVEGDGRETTTETTAPKRP